jgi:hypothetical protein
LIINDAPLSYELTNAIIDGEIVETMDYAAGTLEFSIVDHERLIVHNLLSQWVSANTPVVYTSIVGQRRNKVVPKEWNEIFCTFDGRDYALVQCNKTGDVFDLIFENRSIHEMRRYSKPKLWFRDTYTRAEVIQSMCKEVSPYYIQFYAPELDIIQPIKSTKGLPTPKETVSKKRKSFAKGTKTTVKGHAASPQQQGRMADVLHTGDSHKASYTAETAALITCIELSNFNLVQPHNQSQFGGGSGLFGFINSTTIVDDAVAFFTHSAQLEKQIPGIPPELLAWNIISGNRGGTGESFDFTAAEFARWIPEAKKILDQWGTSYTGGSVSFTEYNRYAFKRGLDGERENSWDCAVRLAKEVNWRVFSTDNIIWWVSDNDLRNSIPWTTIDENTDGIDTIDWEIDSGKPLNSVTITAHLSRWQCPPGVPIMIENCGPADGRWLVFEVRRPMHSDLGEITCHMPSPPLPEPAPTTKQVSISGSKLGTAIAVTGNSKVDAAYAKAVQIANKKYPYVYAGGHASDFSPHGGNGIGYDCSGYVSAILNAAGLLTSPEASGPMMSWGQAGPGRLMTMWTNTGHVFLEFKFPPPVGHVQANTSHSGLLPGQGAAVIPWGGNGQADAQSGSFVARHWPGT